MSQLQDFGFERSGQVGPGESGPSPGRPWAIWLSVVGAVLLLVALALWWSRRGGIGEAAGTTNEPPSRPAEISTPVVATPADPELGDVTVDESDPIIRHLLAAVTDHPNAAEWLGNEGLIRRFVRVVGNIAYDEVPRKHVSFLKPTGPFTVAEVEAGPTTISAASFARYDLLAEVFASLDVGKTQAIYRRLLPLLDNAYAELGYPSSFDSDLRRAIDKLIATPDLSAEQLRVVRSVRSYRYEDPALEELSDAQKQLLRMGPRNQARIETQLRSFSRILASGRAE